MCIRDSLRGSRRLFLFVEGRLLALFCATRASVLGEPVAVQLCEAHAANLERWKASFCVGFGVEERGGLHTGIDGHMQRHRHPDLHTQNAHTK